MFGLRRVLCRARHRFVEQACGRALRASHGRPEMPHLREQTGGMQELLKRVSKIEQIAPEKYLRSNFIRGIKNLPVRLTSA